MNLRVIATTVGEGEKGRSIQSDKVWVNPSIQLAAMDKGVKELTADGAAPQAENSSTKASVFSRLGNSMGGAGKEKQGSPFKSQPEVNQGYSPRQVSKWIP